MREEKNWGAPITDHSKLGLPMPKLLPCLTNKTSEKDQKNKEIMSMRYLDMDEWQAKLTNTEETDLEELIDICRLFADFIPTPEVLKALILRMIQVKNIETQVWLGFEPVPNLKNVWKPHTEISKHFQVLDVYEEERGIDKSKPVDTPESLKKIAETQDALDQIAARRAVGVLKQSPGKKSAQNSIDQ